MLTDSANTAVAVTDRVTVEEAARRLDRSPSWFRALAKAQGIEVVRRGRLPGVNWREVEQYIAGSRLLPGELDRDY